MTQAGWYPDPAGQPQTYRFWDGSAWSQETTSDPYAPPPAPRAAPPPPPAPPRPPTSSPSQQPPTVVAGGAGAPPSSYGQAPTPGYGAVTPPAPGGYGQQPPFGGGFPPAPTTGGSGGSAKTVLLVVAAVLVLILLSAGGFFGVRALTGDDDDADNDAGDSSSATDTATDETEATDPTDESTATEEATATEGTTGTTAPPATQCTGGIPDPSVTPRRNADRISGGALSIPIPADFKPEVLFAPAFAWADNFTPLVRTVEENPEAQTSWFSIFGVGGLRKANGFDDPAVAAEVVMTCMIESPDQYSDVTGRTEVSSGEITVDGTDAYQLTVEIRVDNADLETEGDIAQVIVVDMGDPDMFGLYISQVPIGDQELLDLQASMVDRILVD